MMFEQPPSDSQFTMSFGQDDPYGQSSHHFSGQEPLFSRLTDVESNSAGEAYTDLQKQLEATQAQLNVYKRRTLELEQMLGNLGNTRLELEAKLRDSNLQKIHEVEMRNKEIAELRTENEHLKRTTHQTIDNYRRVERELINVLQKKYDMVENAKREARRQFAEEEKIRNELARQQQRYDRQKANGTHTAAHRPNIPTGDPRAVRSHIAVRQLRDFFDS